MYFIYLLLFFIFLALLFKRDRRDILYIIEEDNIIRFLISEETYLIIDIKRNCKVSKIDCIKAILKKYSKELSSIVYNIIYVGKNKKSLNQQLIDILQANWLFVFLMLL